jgi:protein-arginine kinase
MSIVYKRLKDFKLSGISANLEERLSYANDKELGYLEFYNATSFLDNKISH